MFRIGVRLRLGGPCVLENLGGIFRFLLRGGVRLRLLVFACEELRELCLSGCLRGLPGGEGGLCRGELVVGGGDPLVEVRDEGVGVGFGAVGTAVVHRSCFSACAIADTARTAGPGKIQVVADITICGTGVILVSILFLCIPHVEGPVHIIRASPVFTVYI